MRRRPTHQELVSLTLTLALTPTLALALALTLALALALTLALTLTRSCESGEQLDVLKAGKAAVHRLALSADGTHVLPQKSNRPSWPCPPPAPTLPPPPPTHTPPRPLTPNTASDPTYLTRCCSRGRPYASCNARGGSDCSASPVRRVADLPPPTHTHTHTHHHHHHHPSSSSLPAYLHRQPTHCQPR